MKIYNPFSQLSKSEWLIWIGSTISVVLSFFISGKFQILSLIASMVGLTALIFVAKGDVFGQILMVIFSILYAVISLKFYYYGEMITYLGMTAPIAAMSVVSWVKNPYESNKNQVKVARLNTKQIIIMILGAIITTTAFHFILKYFNTTNLLFSTISITTSFLASYLMLYRSSLYAVAYAANDVVLIVLWVLASTEDLSYFPMAICFIVFFMNDIYGFYNWQRMKQKQKKVVC